MTHRNTSKTRGKNPVELLLERRVRLPAIADFDLCKPILFKANKKAKTVPATFIIRKGLNTSFIQPKNSARIILVSDNQITRLDEDNVKTEPAVEETISQSEPQHQNTDVEPLHQDEASVATPSAEHQQAEPSEPSRTSTRNRKQTDRFGDPIHTNLLKMEGGCYGCKQTSRNLEVLLKFRRTKEELSWRALSISNDHKTKIISNSALALSLFYWPINHMSEVNSPTNRNLILTTTNIQLMNSAVSRPSITRTK